MLSPALGWLYVLLNRFISSIHTGVPSCSCLPHKGDISPSDSPPLQQREPAGLGHGYNSTEG